MGVNVHVVPEGDRWAVKCEQHAHEKAHYTTQEQAIDAGQGLASREHSELVIHAQTGEIRAKWSYGNDPRDIPG